MWCVYAVLSAVFAAATAILAKMGVNGINSNLATAVRTVVILALVWGIVFFNGTLSQIREFSRSNWIFLILSGVATGLSWLFYFKALQLGNVSKVAPIDKLSVAITIFLGVFLLHEQPDLKVIAGGILIVLGSLVLIW